MNNYEGEKYKVKLWSMVICTTCCLFGSIVGIGAYFTYSNNMFCHVTSNHFLCRSSSGEDSSKPDLCIECNTTNITTYANATNLTNITTYANTTDILLKTNSSGFGNMSGISNIYGNINDTYIWNKTEPVLNQYIIRNANNIENNVDGNKVTADVGAALAVSVASVFIFIGCVSAVGWYVKYKPNPIKNYITNKSASKPIKLTKEEIEISQINPIMKALGENNKSLMAKAIRNITLATEKDHDHDFSEALALYNKGIEQLMVYMKHVNNAGERFQMAKKIDVYVKRATYLQTVILNMEEIRCVDKGPVAPLMEKKCVCDANTLV